MFMATNGVFHVAHKGRVRRRPNMRGIQSRKDFGEKPGRAEHLRRLHDGDSFRSFVDTHLFARAGPRDQARKFRERILDRNVRCAHLSMINLRPLAPARREPRPRPGETQWRPAQAAWAPAGPPCASRAWWRSARR